MSNDFKYLQTYDGRYTSAMDLAAMRALLRAERHRRQWSLDDLAAHSGVTRSAIHDIETNKGGKPRFETIARLIEAMPGLTLSAFFLQIEQAAGQNETGRPPAQPPSPSSSTQNSVPVGGSTLAEGLVDDLAVSTRSALGRAFIDLAFTYTRAAAALAGEQAPSARVDKPARPLSHRKHRR